MKQRKILSLLLSALLLFTLISPAFAVKSDTCHHVWLETGREAQGRHTLDVGRHVLVYRIYQTCVEEGCGAVTSSLEVKHEDLSRYYSCCGALPLSQRTPIDLLM